MYLSRGGFELEIEPFEGDNLNLLKLLKVLPKKILNNPENLEFNFYTYYTDFKDKDLDQFFPESLRKFGVVRTNGIRIKFAIDTVKKDLYKLLNTYRFPEKEEEVLREFLFQLEKTKRKYETIYPILTLTKVPSLTSQTEQENIVEISIDKYLVPFLIVQKVVKKKTNLHTPFELIEEALRKRIRV